MKNILLWEYKRKPILYYIMNLVSFADMQKIFISITNEGYSEVNKLRKKAELEMHEFLNQNPKIREKIDKIFLE